MLFKNKASTDLKSRKRVLAIITGTGGTKALEYIAPPVAGETAESEPAEIINYIELPYSPVPAVEEKAILAAIRREIDEIKKKSVHDRVDYIVFILNSPWYFSQTRIITVERTEPFRIDKNLVGKLLEEEKEIFTNLAASRFEIPDNDSAELLEVAVMRSLLNGYETGTFLGKDAKHLQLFIYISMTLASLTAKLNSAAEAKFSPKKILTHSNPYVMFRSALPALGIDSAGAVVIDIEGEITDITVLRDGVISETLSFGRGLNFILRRIAGAYSITPAEAISRLKALASNHLSDGEGREFTEILSRAASEWQKMFAECLRHASGSRLLPSRFILTGEGADFEIFSSGVKSGEVNSLIYKTSPLNIEILYPKNFRGRLRGDGKHFGAGPSASLLFLSVFDSEQIL